MAWHDCCRNFCLGSFFLSCLAGDFLNVGSISMSMQRGITVAYAKEARKAGCSIILSAYKLLT